MSADWRQITRLAWPVAARALHWTPEQFWRATPAELLGALADPSGPGAPLSRDEMTRLMRRTRERDDG